MQIFVRKKKKKKKKKKIFFPFLIFCFLYILVCLNQNLELHVQQYLKIFISEEVIL